MKLIRTNRDKVFWSIWALYLICTIVFACVLKYEAIYVHSFALLCFTILFITDHASNKFNEWLNRSISCKSSYMLSSEEAILWDSITKKASKGYYEFCEQCKKDDNYNVSWPWMSPYLTKEEDELITKIHEYFYPYDYIVDPISASQAAYAWYDEIRHKVKMK